MGEGRTTLGSLNRLPKLGIAFLLNKLDKEIHAKNEKVRDKGSPCLIPLDENIKSRTSPLNEIDVETIETQLMIMSIKLARKFALKRISLMKLHSSLS